MATLISILKSATAIFPHSFALGKLIRQCDFYNVHVFSAECGHVRVYIKTV